MENVTLPNYSYVFKFEEDFDTYVQRKWMQKNWVMCFYYVGAYMLTVFGGKIYMERRPRFELRSLLFLWNSFLSVFSIWGVYRTLPELVYVLTTFGFHYSACIRGPSFLDNNIGGFWIWMFTLSKVPELGDTIFIVLRKQPLIFLHWYHHVTVLVYSWYSYPEYIATARWFVAMNYCVHSFMYSYYALKSLKVRVPRWISMSITIAQLSQMIMGTIVNLWAYQMKQNGYECHPPYDNIKLSLLMYTSYFVLFAHFFRKSYLCPPRKYSDSTVSSNRGKINYDKGEKRKTA